MVQLFRFHVQSLSVGKYYTRPSEGGNQFTNGFQNLTNKHPFSSCSLLLAVLVLERKVIPNTAILVNIAF